MCHNVLLLKNGSRGKGGQGGSSRPDDFLSEQFANAAGRQNKTSNADTPFDTAAKRKAVSVPGQARALYSWKTSLSILREDIGTARVHMHGCLPSNLYSYVCTCLISAKCCTYVKAIGRLQAVSSAALKYVTFYIQVFSKNGNLETGQISENTENMKRTSVCYTV